MDQPVTPALSPPTGRGGSPRTGAAPETPHRRRSTDRFLPGRDAGLRGGDHGAAGGLARGAAGRSLSRRGTILVLGQAPRLGLLLEAAAGRLADRTDHRDIRGQRIRRSAVGAVSPCRYGALDLCDRRAALRTPHRVLVGARLRNASRRLGLGLYHIDRCTAGAVLGGSTLCLCPRARGRWLALVDRRRHRRRLRLVGQIRDGLLAAVGVRICSDRGRRAPASRGLIGRARRGLCHLFAEPVVELEQRLRQLPSHPRQCRARRQPLSPARLS